MLNLVLLTSSGYVIVRTHLSIRVEHGGCSDAFATDRPRRIIIIIIIMGLKSVSASEDVIGDLPSPWATISP